MADNTQVAEQTKQTKVQAKPKSWSEMLDGRLVSIEDALPKDLNKTRFVQNALTVVQENKDIQKFPQEQILAGLVKGAVLGLDFMNHEAYLVGYGSQLQFQLSYRGAVKLAKKYSIEPIKGVHADVVRDGDVFNYEVKDNKTVINFKPIPFNNGEVIGAYAYVEFENGDIVAELMNIDELNAVQKSSKMGNGGAWKSYPNEMRKKSVIKRLMKHIDLEMETPQQRQIYDDDEAIASTPEDVIDSVAVEVEENANSVPFEVEE